MTRPSQCKRLLNTHPNCMTTRLRNLLAIDALVNLVLGAALLASPAGVIDFLGLPPVRTYFYASVLGGVIFGIGVALMLELRGRRHSLRGLSLPGAIAINICGGCVLVGWLTLSRIPIRPRGLVILWVVAVLVLGIAVVELLSGAWRED